MNNVTIVLIEPENPGNSGAICRSMKNFEFKNLILINPKFELNSEELRNRAKWANDIVDIAKVITNYDEGIKTLKKDFDCIIATTARIGRDYNVSRSPITPEELIKTISKKTKIALIIGRESSGLNNNEINMCDFTITIPTSKKYATMNISHATTILLYELFKNKENILSHIKPASRIDKEQTLKILDDKLKIMNFSTPAKAQTQRIVWKKILSKSFISKREIFAIMGFLKKINNEKNKITKNKK